MTRIPLTSEQAETFHATIRGFIERIRAKSSTEPISPLWIEALGKDYYFEDDPTPVVTTTKVNYEEYIKSYEWKQKADAAKARAGYACQVCNNKQYLNAHHRTYERLGNEADGDILVLCRDCHKLFSENGKLAK